MTDTLHVTVLVQAVRCLKCQKKEEVETQAHAEAFVKRHILCHFSDLSKLEMTCVITEPTVIAGKHVTMVWRKE